MNTAENPHHTVTFVSCKNLVCTSWQFSLTQMRHLWVSTCSMRWKSDLYARRIFQGQESPITILCNVYFLRVCPGRAFPIAELLESYMNRSSKVYA